MTRQPRSERGAEIVQLAFAMPLLVLAFVVTAQMMIWGFEIVQFSSAGESAAYGVDLEQLEGLDSASSQAKDLVKSEITSRMIGDAQQTVTVERVSLVTTPATSSVSGQALAEDSYRYSTTQATGRISFTARMTCPSLFQIGEPLVLERTWQRDRLVYRRVELSR